MTKGSVYHWVLVALLIAVVGIGIALTSRGGGEARSPGHPGERAESIEPAEGTARERADAPTDATSGGAPPRTSEPSGAPSEEEWTKILALLERGDWSRAWGRLQASGAKTWDGTELGPKVVSAYGTTMELVARQRRDGLRRTKEAASIEALEGLLQSVRPKKVFVQGITTVCGTLSRVEGDWTKRRIWGLLMQLAMSEDVLPHEEAYQLIGPTLEEMVKASEDRQLSQLCARLIGDLSTRRSAEFLAELKRDGDANWRQVISLTSESCVETLVDILRSAKNDEEARLICSALVNCGPTGRRSLGEILASYREDSRDLEYYVVVGGTTVLGHTIRSAEDVREIEKLVVDSPVLLELLTNSVSEAARIHEPIRAAVGEYVKSAPSSELSQSLRRAGVVD